MTKQSSFIATIRDWVNRQDFSDSLVTSFTRLAEERMNANLRANSPGLVTKVVLSSTSNSVALPDNWLENVYVRPAGGIVYRYATPAEFFEASQMWSDNYNTPLYTNIGGVLSLGPAIADGSQIELCYYNRLPPLVDDVSNFVFDKNFTVYLYGTVTEAFKYLQDADMAAASEELFMAAVQAVNDYSTHATTSGSPLRRAYKGFG